MAEQQVLRVNCDGPQCIALEDIPVELRSPDKWFRVEQVKILGQTEQGTQVQRTTWNYCSLPCLVAAHGQEWLAQADQDQQDIADFSKAFTDTIDIMTGKQSLAIVQTPETGEIDGGHAG